MPKKIDPKVKQRCVQQMLEHAQEYPTPTAAAEAIARRNGVGTESVRRWYLQSQVDGGQRSGATSLDDIAPPSTAGRRRASSDPPWRRAQREAGVRSRS